MGQTATARLLGAHGVRHKTVRMQSQELDHILIRGAREHNLKGVDVKIPKKRLVVFTGVSGSGKSSLAFDTLYAEGQRRYVESLSAYARQFLGQMEKPKYETIRGLGPTISIEQKTTGSNPRSTVGTITEISDYLRVLFARTGVQHCYQCGNKVSGQSAEQIALDIASLPTGSKLWLLCALVTNRKGEHREILAEAQAEGLVRLRVDGTVVKSEDIGVLDKKKKHTIEAVVDRLITGQATVQRITESVEQALRRGKGALTVWNETTDTEQMYSEHFACETCGISFPELTPAGFSFNSPLGMCPDCNGLGTRLQIDEQLVIPDPSKSIDDGAIAPWGEDVSEKNTWDFRAQILEALKVNTAKPFNKLTSKTQRELLQGTGDKKYSVTWKAKSGQGQFEIEWEGIIPRLMRRFKQTQSENARQWYSNFMNDTLCSSCNGMRLRPESRSVRVAEKTLADLSAMTVADVAKFFAKLELPGAKGEIAREVVKELRARLGFLNAVGLDYLSLDRAGPTLSGGESQRIRLASQVGSELTGVIYVLDEPSIGLHQRDNQRLLETLLRMRDIGNTVVCVEHDEDTIRAADHVIDFGPGAGISGGEIVFSGSPRDLERCKSSLTGHYLSGRRRIQPVPRRTPSGWLEIKGANANNLKGVDVDVPLGVMVSVTGVSGAGKSTLINDVLCPTIEAHFAGSKTPQKLKSITGLKRIDRLIRIDQKAIGRTPRSNPITYIKVFDAIRVFFASLPESKARGYTPGRFSFNVKGGRCEHCEGDGVRQIEMHFLADVYVKCEQCNGKRYNRSTLDVTYKGKSIADVLELTVAEARGLFAAHPAVERPLSLLSEVGLDYMPLGQPSPTLSGGEAQRIKLARELSKRGTGKTLYVLDEPTTGLHFEDIRRLLDVLQKLVDLGNTVLLIEHNLDVIRCSDYVIDMGPEGGPAGGRLMATGTPEALAQAKGSHTGAFLRKALKR
jgi:excinuclease ABC subunit A